MVLALGSLACEHFGGMLYNEIVLSRIGPCGFRDSAFHTGVVMKPGVFRKGCEMPRGEGLTLPRFRI